MTLVEICNLALGFIGAAQIASLSESSTEASLCNANAATVRDAILEERDWAFASDWRLLDLSATVPTTPRYLQLIEKPSDCIAVREVVNAADEPLDWALCDDGIMLNDADTTSQDVAGDFDPSWARSDGSGWGAVSATVIDISGLTEIDGWPASGRVSVTDLLAEETAVFEYTDRAARSITLAEAIPNDWNGTLHFVCISGEAIGDAYVRLTKQVTDTTLWPANFREAFAHRLASVLAIPLAGNARLRESEWALYEAIMRKSASHDSMQGRPFKGPHISTLKNARNS